MNYAQILDDKVVNVVTGDYAACDASAKSIYGDEAFAVEYGDLNVNIGDRYSGGHFYKIIDGEWRINE